MRSVGGRAAFASRSLAAAERNYSQLDKEALAVVFGVTRFKQYLCGQQPITSHFWGFSRQISSFRSLARLDYLAGPSSSCLAMITCSSTDLVAASDSLSQLPLPTAEMHVENSACYSSATNKDPCLSSLGENSQGSVVEATRLQKMSVLYSARKQGRPTCYDCCIQKMKAVAMDNGTRVPHLPRKTAITNQAMTVLPD